MWDKPGSRLKKGWWKRYTALGCLLVDEGAGIAIHNRGKDLKYRFESIYAIEDLYIPLWAIRASAIETHPDQRERLPFTLTFSLDGHNFRYGLSAPPPQLQLTPC